MAKSDKRSEIEETYISGGIVGEGSVIYWKKIQFLEDMLMLEELKKIRNEYGNGPFVIMRVLKDSEENIFIRFKDANGNNQEVNEGFFCSDKATGLSEGDVLQLATKGIV